MKLPEKQFIDELTKKVKEELNCIVTVTKDVEDCLAIRNENSNVIHQLPLDMLECLIEDNSLETLLDLCCLLVYRAMRRVDIFATEEGKNIYPVLKNEEQLDALLRECENDEMELLYVDSGFIDLFVIFEQNTGNEVEILTTDILETLEVTEEELFSLAIHNLENKKSFPTHVNEGDVKMTYYDCGDRYDASRIMTLPFEEIEKGMKGDLLIVIPDRGFLGIFDSTEIENINKLYLTNLKTFKTFVEDCVTPDIFLFKDGEFTEQITGPLDIPFA